jgi:excisionase family DNA binding protein
MPSLSSSAAPGPDGQRGPGGLLNINEIATALRISKMTVYRFIQDGRLPAIRVGKSLRVHRRDLDAFLRDHTGYDDERVIQIPAGVLPRPERSPDPGVGWSAGSDRDHITATVVVGIDGSPGSQDALRFAVREAGFRGGIVRAVMARDPAAAQGGACGPTSDPTALEQADRAALDAVIDTLGREADGVTIERVVSFGDPARILIEEADGADLLVVGSSSLDDRSGQPSDSVGYRCAQHATCPVTVVRARTRTRGRQPRLSATQQATLRRMYATGDYSITHLAELFSVSRPTVYRSLRAAGSTDRDEPAHPSTHG